VLRGIEYGAMRFDPTPNLCPGGEVGARLSASERL